MARRSPFPFYRTGLRPAAIIPTACTFTYQEADIYLPKAAVSAVLQIP